MNGLLQSCSDLTGELAAALSALLRTRAEVSLAGVDRLSYGEFVGSAGNAHLLQPPEGGAAGRLPDALDRAVDPLPDDRPRAGRRARRRAAALPAAERHRASAGRPHRPPLPRSPLPRLERSGRVGAGRSPGGEQPAAAPGAAGGRAGDAGPLPSDAGRFARHDPALPPLPVARTPRRRPAAADTWSGLRRRPHRCRKAPLRPRRPRRSS